MACLLLAGAATGCAGPELQEVDATASAEISQLPLPEPTASQRPAARELNISMLAGQTTFHPWSVALTEDAENVLSLLFEPAIKLDGDGRFAASVIEKWDVSEDGLTYTFDVRQGVQAHDGSTVTADDIVFCLQKIVDSGAEECTWSKYKASVLSFEKTGDLQVTLRAAQKTADILYLMTFPVLPRSVYGSRSFVSTETPVGTGPYAVESYTAEAGFALVRNEAWWKAPPTAERIYVKPVAEEADKISNYQLGLLDCVSTDMLTVNSYSAENQTKVLSAVTPEYTCLLPNMRNAFLKDERIRRAISTALDRSEIISNSVLGEGLATETCIRPDLWYFNETTDVINAYNINEANRMLEEAGFTLDEETGYRYCTDESGEKQWLAFNIIYAESSEMNYRGSILGAVERQLKKAGIQIRVVKKEGEEYLSLLQAKTFDMALATFYTNTNNDISFMLTGAYNYGEFADDDLPALMQSARQAVTEAEMQSAYVALQKALVEKLPQIGLFFREHSLVLKADIQVTTRLRFRNLYADMDSWK